MTMTLDGSNGLSLSGQFNSASSFGFKNRIINGAMMIDQRNAGGSVNPTDGQYTLDRWQIQRSQASKLTVQQNAGSVTPQVGFKNYLGITSSSAYTVLSTDYFMLTQYIEGFNIADLAWGTANAKTVTLSFQVYSSLTGTFGGALRNSGGARAYPFSYSIPVANTWTSISITISGDTSGTWATGNTTGIEVDFGLGVGTTYSNTAGAWVAGAYFSATGATSVVGTSGATFYITGVQLEKGSTATSFDYRPYGTELALCQRYFETSFDVGTAPANAVATNNRKVGTAYNTNTIGIATFFVVPKRAVPTLVFYAGSATGGSTYWGRYSGGSWVQGTAQAYTGYATSFETDITVTATANTAYILTGNWAASAEL